MFNVDILPVISELFLVIKAVLCECAFHRVDLGSAPHLLGTRVVVRKHGSDRGPESVLEQRQSSLASLVGG